MTAKTTANTIAARFPSLQSTQGICRQCGLGSGDGPTVPLPDGRHCAICLDEFATDRGVCHECGTTEWPSEQATCPRCGQPAKEMRAIGIGYELKAWGVCQHRSSEPTAQLDAIWMNSGGKSSWHHHERKVNAISVLSGVLLLNKRAGDLITRLSAGRLLVVPAGVVHQIEAETDVRAIELYLPAGPGWTVDPCDIVRHQQPIEAAQS